MMKVLVFGGTGWLGSRIVKQFASTGYDVTICSLDDVSSENMIKADKNNEKEMKEIFKAEKYNNRADEIGLRFFAEHMCHDISKAKELLGYIPGYTMEEAIEESARWTVESLKFS